MDNKLSLKGAWPLVRSREPFKF